MEVLIDEIIVSAARVLIYSGTSLERVRSIYHPILAPELL